MLNGDVTLLVGESPAEAFEFGVESARHQYGHRGATGTIAEAKSFEVVDGVPLMLAWSARHEGNRMLRDGVLVAGGPTLLIPVGEPDGRLKVRNMMVLMNGVAPGWDYQDWAAREIIRYYRTTTRVGGSLEDLQIVRWCDEPRLGPRKVGKVTSTPTFEHVLGGREKVYQVVFRGETVFTGLSRFEAVQWVKEQVTADPYEFGVYTVVGVYARADGEPVFRGFRRVRTERAFVQARIANVQAGLPVARWAAVGLYPYEPFTPDGLIVPEVPPRENV